MDSKFSRFKTFLNSPKAALWVILGIIAINSTIYLVTERSDIPTQQKRKDASGFSHSRAEKFAYFHYYTGNFPLATLNNELTYSEQGALEEIQENGTDLIMEYQHWSRLGESARIWAYLPNSIVSGTPEKPRIKLFNTLVFVLSLIILFLGFWRIKQSLYGFFLVVLVNLTPFYLFETYDNVNIFALLGSVFFMVLGLNVRYIFNVKIDVKRAFAAAVLSSAIIGFFSEFRNELTIIMVSLVFIYILSKELKIYHKALLVVISFSTFYGVKDLIHHHFEQKFRETADFVAQNNGHVYTGERISGHKFWHPVFCGLGDFDTKYGYEWNDRVPYKYAIPILQDKSGLDIKYSGKLHLDNYYDKDSIYYVKFDEIEIYESIVKDKVINDISNDPLWYTGILFKRICRTLSTTIPIPYIGWLLFVVAYYLIKKKNWWNLKLLIISLPLSATSIIIYSGKGSTYNSVFVYFVLLSLFYLYLDWKKALKE